MIINMELNVYLEIICILFSITFLFNLMFTHSNYKRLGFFLSLAFVFNIVVVGSDLFANILMGDTDNLSIGLSKIFNFNTYLFNYLLIGALGAYIFEFISIKKKISATYWQILRLYVVTTVLLSFLSLYNKMYYYIDESNIYHRADMFWLSQLLAIIGGIFILVVIILSRKNLTKFEITSLLGYNFLIFLAAIVQIFVSGISFIYLTGTIGITILYFTIQSQHIMIRTSKKLNIVRNNIDMFRSQFEPHLIYESLMLVNKYSEREPQVAVSITNDLHNFIRYNNDALNSFEPVTFYNEFELTKYYLSLKKKSLGDRLIINYNIETTNFSIPALTLLLVIKNAVHNTSLTRDKDGLIKITSKNSENGYEITVEENGISFDNSSQDSEVFDGFDFIRKQLNETVNGTIEYEYRPKKDVNSVTKITIPHE